jgi:signal transduction histidine kinase
MKVTAKTNFLTLQVPNRGILVMRGIWILTLILMITLFVIGMPAFVEYTEGRLPTTALARLTIPDENFRDNNLFRIVELSTPLAFFITGVLLFFSRQPQLIVILASLFMISGPPSTIPLLPLAIFHPQWYPLVAIVQAIGFSLFFIFLLVFPNGQFVPRWSIWLAAIWSLYALSWPFSRTLNPFTTDSYLTLIILMVPWVFGIFAQIYRHRFISDKVERQQSKWVVYGFSLLVLAALIIIIPRMAIDLLDQFDTNAVAFVVDLALIPLVFIIPLALPLALGFAIIRYRLWDIDLLINNTLLYGLLTITIMVAYLFAVGALGSLFLDEGSGVVFMIATVLIVVLFQPIRDLYKKLLNRLTYGTRQDPGSILTTLGHNLESTADPEKILPVLVDTVSQTLQLSFLAIDLKNGSLFEEVASRGTSPSGAMKVPLMYHGEKVGQLRAGPKDPDRGFSSADSGIIESIAQQAGVAAHAVQLTRELSSARKRLIEIRTNERQRLRRDLHDSLGPQLATLSVQVETAGNLLRTEPSRAQHLLSDYKFQAQTAISDIRRLVYDLRPPTLDQLGLVPAIEELAESHNIHGDLQIEVRTTGGLPPLPAAVEVAAYRICQEAITNVVRHAQANKCTVALELNENLNLEISDDGIGLPSIYQQGIGLGSMRERAIELGGQFHIDSEATGGTVVHAQLPLIEY